MEESGASETKSEQEDESEEESSEENSNKDQFEREKQMILLALAEVESSEENSSPVSTRNSPEWKVRPSQQNRDSKFILARHKSIENPIKIQAQSEISKKFPKLIGENYFKQNEII
jgi:hypothetical protein